MTSNLTHSVFVDESINRADGFIACAIIVAPRDLSAEIAEALRQAGMTPGRDEYKSSSPKNGQPASQLLRERLRQIIFNGGCRIALTVSSTEERSLIGIHVLQLLRELSASGKLGAVPPNVYMDDGLITPDVHRWMTGEPLDMLVIAPEHDSKKVLGLQLADMVAHSAATILRCELGSLVKSTPAGPGTGYDPDMLIDLDFELWAGLRYNLAGEPMREFDPDDIEASATLAPYGLRISDQCDARVRHAAEKRFGTVYLGCIH